MRPGRAWYSLVVGPGLAALGVASALMMGCRTTREETGGTAMMATPIELTKAIEDYDAEEFSRLVGLDDEKRWRGAPPEERECVGNECGPGRRTRVAIEAMDGAHQVDLRSLSRHGVVIARLRNVGQGRDQMYQVPPMQSIRGFYLVIEPLPPEEFNPDSVNARIKSVEVRSVSAPLRIERWKGQLTDCKHPHDTPPDTTWAAFTGCTKPSVADTGATTPQALLALRGWISCIHGCCEVGVRR